MSCSCYGFLLHNVKENIYKKNNIYSMLSIIYNCYFFFVKLLGIHIRINIILYTYIHTYHSVTYKIILCIQMWPYLCFKFA